MAKKLADIKKYIENENENFHNFFFNSINKDISKFIVELMKHTDVYLFSGIIRDYYLNNKSNKFRDIDLIIQDDLKIEKYFKNYQISKNNFGGYKIEICNTKIDLWVIKNTWGLNQGQLALEFNYLYELPKTTFFNFSSIIYSFNDKEFIIGKDFLIFLRDKKIEVVFPKNPYPELCIVNTIYYSDKFGLKIGNNLVKYLKSNINKYYKKIENIQKKHFGNIIYSSNEIKNRIEIICQNKNT